MKIKDYFIKGKLSKSKRYTVYRAIKEKDSAPYVLKILDKKVANNLNIIKEIEQEYLLLKQIDSRYVIKAFDWMDVKEYSSIVLEDINGKTLKEEIKKGRFSIAQFGRLAIQITKGLAAIHSKNIIHKDINPTNIIRNSQTGSLKIIDFSIASNFDTKVSYSGNPEKLEGTLPYISPEQTGRMNRWVDQRSDLYSLGVTFYEMLTGELPFKDRKPMEIVYSHLAITPKPPNHLNKQVPVILSKVVIKLLAKNPENRYQSAEGLKYDLEMIQKSLADPKSLATIQLGEKDISGKLQIPEKLYGRESEIGHLLQAYQRASNGAKEMVLVAGYSGTGKTALVNEIHKPITKDRGYFISGKFDRLQRNVPYFAFIQALSQFCQLLLSEKKETLAQWKEHILNAVGEMGRVLTDIIPQLESVIGSQPDVPVVGGEDTKRRFNYIFQRFFQAISTKEHPLVIFIDDLQWADLASLDLLQVLMEDKQTGHLLFIGAYRDNEVSPTHPFMMILEEIQKQDIEVDTIPVKNLSLENVQEWLLDTLKISRDTKQKKVVSLADLIYQKTMGNAFFTIQFLENIYKENLLYFNFQQTRWGWDVREIEKQNISDNVVDLLVSKIETFPTEVQEILKLAACIGNVFNLRTLTVISEKNKNEEEKHLELAFNEHLVYPIEEETYRFQHDRIHQAAYSMISDEDKNPLHLKIGRLLLKEFDAARDSIGSQKAEKHLFDIVNHLNVGIELIETEKEKMELARLNLESAQNARVSAAYKLGIYYVKAVIRLLPEDCWQKHYDLALATYNEAIQTSFLNGNYEEMENFGKIVLKFSLDLSDRALAYTVLLQSYITQNKPQLATDTFLSVLNELDVNIPKSPGKSEIEETLQEARDMFSKMGEKIINLPLMSDPQKKLALKLFPYGIDGIIFTNQELMPYVVSKIVIVSLEYGITPETPIVFTYFATVSNFIGDTSGAYRASEISMVLLNKMSSNEIIKTRVICLNSLFAFGWKMHFKEVIKRLLESYQYALNSGEFEYVGISLINYIMYLCRTDPVVIVNEKSKIFTKKLMEFDMPLFYRPMQAEILVSSDLLNQSTTPAFLNKDLTEYTKDFLPGSVVQYECIVTIRKIFLAYLFEEYTHMLEFIEKMEINMLSLATPFISVKTDFQFYIPLAYLQLYIRTESKKEKETYLRKVKEGMKIMKEWADFGPVNFLHKYYLQQAELCRVMDKSHEAAEYYDKAVEKAYENEYINEAALANELAAKFYMQQNRHKLAAMYFLEARDCYSKWGAIAKVKHLEENYPKYLSLGIPGTKISITGTISSASTDATGETLDVKSIIKASQTLSGEVHLENLLEKMMNILIENAGAQKGFFIEKSGESLLVQAEGTKDAVSGILDALPVEESDKLPHSVINYVARSKKKLVFDNISKDASYSADKYIQKHQPKSVVCFPILRHDELSAVIYLENNLVEGAFTPERVEVLNTLSSQIAISMENARIYRDLEELNINLEKKVAERTEQLEEMDKIKSRFFANISHEFRTPLTLIMGPLEQRLGESRDKSHVEEMQMMLRNSRRLLTLINQLLDLSKLESGRMILQTSEQDVIPFLKGVVGSFESLAEQKELDLAFQTEQENISLYYDTEKLEKIVVNLVANAIKFTPAGGKVTVSTAEHPEEVEKYSAGYLEIKVCDTGKGIAEDQLPYVFDRFYQAGSSTDRQKRGTGIGLALVKELVELHHGDVSVESTEGKGSEFTVCLPLGKEHLEPEAISSGEPTTWAGDENQGGFFEKTAPDKEDAVRLSQFSTLPRGKFPQKTFDLEDETIVEEEKASVAEVIEKEEQEKDVILIVEDNPDVRKFVRGPLEPLYNVVEAENGREGIDKAKEIIPDLIVSDVMMPEVDGYELCDTLKKDIQTSHIPIVMLTAKASDKSMIQGLETGADDYLTKPFNTKILLTRIKNLIDLRRGLQEKIQREMVLQPTEIAVSSVDQEFIKELKEVIEKNLSDEEFNVDKLAQAMVMGRATLNRKIRAITGESTNQFIQSYRLKRAAQLLKAKFGNVTEVSFEVGFSSSAYFTKCFREKFHQPPHTYLAAEAE